jgi:DNA-binding NarL/FixJ family response regulator|nr:MAG TPA: Protein of unknown function (DUF1492) [Caudoviricetes sp.]
MSKLSADLIQAVHAVEAKYGSTSKAPYIVIRRLMKRELTHEAIALKLGLSLSTVNKRIRQIGAGEGHEIAGN